jgi:CHAD domain-containing protein
MRQYARLQTAVLLRRLAFQVHRTGLSGGADSIHDLRVAIRRLSRCLRAFAQFYPGRSWKKTRSELASLMEAAGRVRDRDITLELLGECGASPRAAIVKQLAAERDAAARDLLGEIRRWEHRDFSRKWRARLEL